MWYNRGSCLSNRTPIQDDDFDFQSSDYLNYYFDNGKPFLTTQTERREFKKTNKKYGKTTISLRRGSGSGSSSHYEAETTQVDDSAAQVFEAETTHLDASHPQVFDASPVPPYVPDFMYSEAQQFEHMTSMMSNTTICQPTFPEYMGEHSGGNEDDYQTPEQAQRPQRSRRPPRHYHSTTPRHRQEL